MTDTYGPRADAAKLRAAAEVIGRISVNPRSFIPRLLCKVLRRTADRLEKKANA